MGLSESIQERVIEKLVEKFGESSRSRIVPGVRQVAERWRLDVDGSEEVFEKFCLEHFLAESNKRNQVFNRFQRNLESLFGHLHQIDRRFNWALHVDSGPIIPVDYLFARYDVYAHVSEDLFKTKLAFVVLLNYPLFSLKEKSQQGEGWSRKKWAEARLADIFANRVPADVSQKRSEAYTLADDYISHYNIYMHNLLNQNGQRLFPEGLKLISHWGLRDELKAQYVQPDGLPRQQMIVKVMERIIRQEIPQVVVNNSEVDWNPFTNEVFKAGTGQKLAAESETSRRYEFLWKVFEGERRVDPYTPQTPSLIARRFKQDREILEQDVENLLHSILTAPVLKDIATLIQRRLGRGLQPFDIWYTGFKPRSQFSEAKLDEIVKQKYPTLESFQKDLPVILRKLGFSTSKAEFLAEHIQVDPSRGAGHAMGVRMRTDKAHLRTRVPKGGMNYKGFNIAIHELGHNVEQVFSLNGMDYYTLQGVPNTAFTEAFAFVFQSRDLDLLGLAGKNSQAENLRVVNDMWAAFEISGVALTDMKIWRWMYDHLDAGPVTLRNATLEIARQVWNEYFAPVLGIKDQILLAVYSHIIDAGMYTPDYSIGQVISFQIEKYLKTHDLAKEMERMCKLGRLAPQVWMKQAVGQPISAEALIDAATEVIKHLE